MRVLSFSIVGKKKKWPCELMTKLTSPRGDPGRVEIRICTVDMALGLKNIGTQGTVRFIHARDCGIHSALNGFISLF